VETEQIGGLAEHRVLQCQLASANETQYRRGAIEQGDVCPHRFPA
jgi:hypothetical protein